MSTEQQVILFRIFTPLRIAGWSLAAALLFVPLIAMQFTEEVNWTGGDFLVFAAMLVTTGAAIELAMRLSSRLQVRLIAAAGILAAFLFVWGALATA